MLTTWIGYGMHRYASGVVITIAENYNPNVDELYRVEAFNTGYGSLPEETYFSYKCRTAGRAKDVYQDLIKVYDVLEGQDQIPMPRWETDEKG